jgi:hypothetical protein
MTAPRDDSDADLHNRFTFHPATEWTAPMHQEVRDRAYAFALAMRDLVPPGRELSLTITKIEEAMMWANAAIARDTTDAT